MARLFNCQMNILHWLKGGNKKYRDVTERETREVSRNQQIANI